MNDLHAPPAAVLDDSVNVLIVDDVPENVLALTAVVEAVGVNVLSAASGAEALEVLLAHDVAVVLLDVQMPGMDGFEVAELMRGSARTRNTPIIFVTAGEHDSGRVFRGYESGAVDFLFKPLDPLVIRGKVDVFRRLHRQRQELNQRLVELREALHMNELLTAVLSHDLRGPLSTVLHGAALVRTKADDVQVVAAADRIASAGQRMSRLVEQLLDAARLRTGQSLLRPARVDLKSVCEEVRSEFHDEEGAARITVEAHGSTEGLWDCDRLGQLVSNLVGNAIAHGYAGTPVELVLDGREEKSVRLSVRNAGSLSGDAAASMVRPFSGANGEPRRGLGLGLYIASQIARAHGGRIQARSDCDSTSMLLELPRAAEPGSPLPFAPPMH